MEDHEEGESIAALARIYSVSRKTIYKWLARHDAEGVAGLADRSRVPQNFPGKVSDEVIAQIIAARQRWRWGPRKLRVKLATAHPETVWPAESTMGEVLKRAGLTHPRKPRVRTPPYGQPFASVDSANRTWCADFKGWFRTGDGTRCDPVTMTDAHSRYLLRCHITPKTDGVHVDAIFNAAFHEYGLPLFMHTDNGVPFASVAPGGLSRVSMNWVKLAIPLMTQTSQRVTHLYELMDSAYDADPIHAHSRQLNHVPIIAPHPRRGTKKSSQLPKVFPDKPTPQLTWAQRDRYKTRTMVERVNARLKDEFGASQIRVRGAAKVMAHLMFGVLALTVDQWLRLSASG